MLSVLQKRKEGKPALDGGLHGITIKICDENKSIGEKRDLLRGGDTDNAKGGQRRADNKGQQPQSALVQSPKGRITDNP